METTILDRFKTALQDIFNQRIKEFEAAGDEDSIVDAQQERIALGRVQKADKLSDIVFVLQDHNWKKEEFLAELVAALEPNIDDGSLERVLYDWP